MRILLVEDDGAFAQAVVAVLAQQNYAVDIAKDGETGWELTRTWEYDLIVLDVMLPKLDGISLCRQLREQGQRMPILLLTAKDAATDKVLGLDAGADDYVVKPLNFQELTARIRALLRRGNSATSSILEWAELCLDPRSCEVTYRGQALQLTPTEYSLLELFLRNPERVFSRGAIIENLWAFDDPPGEDTIRSHIKGLRQKLKAVEAPADLIQTVYGLGYRLRPLTHGQPAQMLDQTAPPSPQQQAQEAVDQAREAFKARIHERLLVLEEAIAAIARGSLSAELRQRAEQEAHRLAGSLGSFGFERGSQFAHAIQEGLRGQEGMGPRQAQDLNQFLQRLRQDLEQPLKPGIETLSQHQQHQNLLLVVSDDQAWIERLAAAAEPRGMRVKSAANPAAARQLLSDCRATAVLLELGSDPDRYRLIREFSSFVPPVPIIAFTAPGQDDLRHRLQVVRQGGQGFLTKSMPSNQVLTLVNQVLQRFRPAERQVMVVDDDPDLLSAICSLLQTWGFRVTTLADPHRFWDCLIEFAPDVLILDVEMPDIDGVELCRVVRNDPRWSGLPVLFLTVHTDADTVDRIYAAGADDYVSKPIREPELITRIFNRLERAQLLKKMATTDTLAGIANRSQFVQELGQLLHLATEHQQPLCLGILKLNGLRQMHEQYGDALADQVLRRTAQFLRRSLRAARRRSLSGLEAAARWGQAEFIVGLYGMTSDQGYKWFAEVLAGLEQQNGTDFNPPGFRVNFSVGTAQFPEDGADLQSLYRMAKSLAAVSVHPDVN